MGRGGCALDGKKENSVMITERKGVVGYGQLEKDV